MLNVKMQPTQANKLAPKIIVVGVGGAGGNAVNNMISSGLEGCEFLVCNTDAQALEGSLSSNKVQLGVNVTGGLGAGSKPEVGKAAAEESIEEVMQYLEGANMAFITAGAGGGTGSGAAPEIMNACRERGILTVGVVTKPFHFEGTHRMTIAENAINEMQDRVDTLIVIPNQNLFRVANEKTTFADAFCMADGVLQSGVRGVTDLMVRPGLVNLDFADVRTAMLEMGKAMMGTGEASGDKRALEAAEAAINNPLLDDISMKGAHGVIINVTGGYDMTLFEADEACNRIRDEVDSQANIIFGATFDESLEGTMRVSIVATGIEKEAEKKRRSGGGSSMFERAKPNTSGGDSSPGGEEVPEELVEEPKAEYAAASVSSPSISAPSYSASASIQGITAPTSLSDMAVSSQSTGTDREGENVPRNTALRGARFNDSFIPPKPVDALSQQHTMEEHSPSVMGAPMAPSPMQERPAAVGGIKLNPPKLPVASEKKRSPSLFERITGSVQQHLEGVVGGDDKSVAAKARIAPSPQTAAIPQRPAQGSLNIDSPAGKPEGVEGDLDIPAFLRRQAN